MPVFTTSQEWLQQSQLLLAARPLTTIITSRYSVRPAGGKPPKDGEKLPDAKPPRAKLVLKTYDPASGACLRYRTTKAAEVSRLVQMLGSLGRRMAALPPRDDGILDSSAAAAPAEPAPAAEEAAPKSGGSAATTSQAGAQQQQQSQPPKSQQQQGGSGGGGKGKKKKGKR